MTFKEPSKTKMIELKASKKSVFTVVYMQFKFLHLIIESYAIGYKAKINGTRRVKNKLTRK